MSGLFPDPSKGTYKQTYGSTSPVSIAGTTETSLLPPGVGNKVIPAYWLQPGSEVRITVAGVCSTSALPTMTIKVKLGGTTVITQASTALVGSLTSGNFVAICRIQCTAAGAPGSVYISGEVDSIGALGLLSSKVPLNAGPVSLDTTIDEAVDITAQWGGTGHTLQILTGTLELLPVG